MQRLVLGWQASGFAIGGGGRVSKPQSTLARQRLDIPNIEGVRNDPWQKYLVSVNQLEAETGFKFFTALPPGLILLC